MRIPAAFVEASEVVGEKFGCCALRRTVVKTFLVCAGLAMAATNLRAAIMYSASIDCQQSCVTVSLSWAAEPFPVYYAAVDDNLGNVIFALTLGPSAGQTTGSILPNPQTVSGLSPDMIGVISNGQAELSLQEIKPGLVGGGLGKEIDTTPFIAIPEPAAWSLTAAGLTFLFLCAGALRRKSQT